LQALAKLANDCPTGIGQILARECSAEIIVVPAFAHKKRTALDPRTARVKRYPGAATIRQQTKVIYST